jgi:hypothetical protein
MQLVGELKDTEEVLSKSFRVQILKTNLITSLIKFDLYIF